MFYLFLSKRVWNTFQWYTFSLPLLNVVPLATMFVGTRKRPNNVNGGGGGGSGYLKTPLFRKVSKQFCRRLQVNTAYLKRTRLHTLPSRCINFKDKKSLIFDFILSLSLSQLRAIARRHVSYRQKHQYRFFFHWRFHEDRFWVHYFFLNLHQWFATFYTKFWNWYVCRRHYLEGLPSGQAVTRVKVYNSHYRKVSTMQIAGSALTGWSAMSKNNAKVNWNCSKASLCKTPWN